jgi:hypothetical protein
MEMINEDDKSRMLAELLKGVPEGTAAHREMEAMCLADLEAIEPIFDEILARAIYHAVREAVQIIAEEMNPSDREPLLRRLNARVRPTVAV